MRVSSPDVAIFALLIIIHFEFVAKIEVLCYTSAVIPGTNLLYI